MVLAVLNADPSSAYACFRFDDGAAQFSAPVAYGASFHFVANATSGVAVAAKSVDGAGDACDRGSLLNKLQYRTTADALALAPAHVNFVVLTPAPKLLQLKIFDTQDFPEVDTFVLANFAEDASGLENPSAATFCADAFCPGSATLFATLDDGEGGVFVARALGAPCGKGHCGSA